jgi:hypothetical protein
MGETDGQDFYLPDGSVVEQEPEVDSSLPEGTILDISD